MSKGEWVIQITKILLAVGAIFLAILGFGLILKRLDTIISLLNAIH